MHLIDSHCHLDFSDFDDDREVLIERCHQLGIHRFVVPGVSLKTWGRLQRAAAQHAEIIPVFGLHPCFIEQHTIEDISVLEALIETTRPCAIGEIGLDYYNKMLDRIKQRSLFEYQLQLAEKYQLPVILHVRKAHDDVLKILKNHNLYGGIVHAFNGSEQQAKSYDEMGFVFGFGGTALNVNARKIRKLLINLPIESIVLETDSPDMTPIDSLDARNTPLVIYKVAAEMAELKHMSIEAVAEATTLNVSRVLKTPL